MATTPCELPPTAAGWNNIEIYVLTADGVFLYDAPQHVLKVISKQDMRPIAGLEGSVERTDEAGFCENGALESHLCIRYG